MKAAGGKPENSATTAQRRENSNNVKTFLLVFILLPPLAGPKLDVFTYDHLFQPFILLLVESCYQNLASHNIENIFIKLIKNEHCLLFRIIFKYVNQYLKVRSISYNFFNIIFKKIQHNR